LIVLDKNVISETQKKRPDAGLMAWLDAQDPSNLYLTAVTAAELVFGVQCLAPGARRSGLERAVTAILGEDFAGRILPFDLAAARQYGAAVAAARNRGHAVATADGQIGAIALAHGGVPVATRDHTAFAALGVEIIDPWGEGGLRRR
jgi:toxin FitB